MNKPKESDFTSHVAYARELEKYVAEQAAVIEKLTGVIQWIQSRCAGDAMPNWENTPHTGHSRGLILDQTNFALAIPTDSQEILKDWMREQLGEPVAYHFRDDPACFAMPGSGYSREYPTEALDVIPLFGQPEILK